LEVWNLIGRFVLETFKNIPESKAIYKLQNILKEKEMSLKSKIPKLNSKVLKGIVWTVIAMVYIVFRYTYILDIRLIDWIASGAMVTLGVFSIIEGIKISKNKVIQNADIEGSKPRKI
jgi:hypothetical protein